MKANTLGAFLQAKRNALNMTQEDLARRLNTYATSISKWETDRGTPNAENMHLLMIALDLTPADLADFGVQIENLHGYQKSMRLPTPAEADRADVLKVLRGEYKLYSLRPPAIYGNPVPGAGQDWVVTLAADADLGTVAAAWASAVVDTADKFTANLDEALKTLHEMYPNWVIMRGRPVDVIPELF